MWILWSCYFRGQRPNRENKVTAKNMGIRYTNMCIVLNLLIYVLKFATLAIPKIQSSKIPNNCRFRKMPILQSYTHDQIASRPSHNEKLMISAHQVESPLKRPPLARYFPPWITTQTKRYIRNKQILVSEG